ncbi:hypothetical protein CUMW_019100 [Citrus unshiu]|nr:hypothetical protein CUMW_019100 [Citrus unshiu]
MARCLFKAKLLLAPVADGISLSISREDMLQQPIWETYLGLILGSSCWGLRSPSTGVRTGRRVRPVEMCA